MWNSFLWVVCAQNPFHREGVDLSGGLVQCQYLNGWGGDVLMNMLHFSISTLLQSYSSSLNLSSRINFQITGAINFYHCPILIHWSVEQWTVVVWIVYYTDTIKNTDQIKSTERSFIRWIVLSHPLNNRGLIEIVQSTVCAFAIPMPRFQTIKYIKHCWYSFAV